MPSKKIKTQFAALPFRKSAGVRPEILLITSRDTGRWLIPKGWPMKGKKPHEAAAQEAWEEAGVLGRVSKKSLGHYDYEKVSPDRASSVPCRVEVFALAVEVVDEAWPEYGQRQRRWFDPLEASALVDERDLSELLLDFDRQQRRAAEKSERSSGKGSAADRLVEAARGA